MALTPKTTSFINLTNVEKNKSRVYCCSAVPSNKASILAGANAFSKTPRTITLAGLFSMNRSNILLSNILVASMRKFKSYLGKRQVIITQMKITG